MKKEKDNKCFQYATTVALNHEEIRKHPERITKIKPFITFINICEGTNFLSERGFQENVVIFIHIYVYIHTYIYIYIYICIN